MIQKIDAVCLLVENLVKSREFYEKVFKLTVAGEDVGFVEYKFGETALALFQKDEAIAMFPAKFMKASGGMVLALKVENVNQICQELKAKSIHIFEGPKQTSWGQQVAYLHDPDENIIEITSY